MVGTNTVTTTTTTTTMTMDRGMIILTHRGMLTS
jgi:hypothetical protein